MQLTRPPGLPMCLPRRLPLLARRVNVWSRRVNVWSRGVSVSVDGRPLLRTHARLAGDSPSREIWGSVLVWSDVDGPRCER